MIDQQPHQFGNRDGRMGVVELQREFAVKIAGGHSLSLQDPEHVLQRTADKEDLLTETQALALLQLVIGIEHFGQCFRLHLLQHGPRVITSVERGKVEGVGSLGRPESQGVGGMDPEAEDRGVIGDADHGLASDPHRIAPLRPDHLPGIAACQPGIGAFHLSVAADLLPEDAELITDAVTDGRQLQGGHGFLETGRQATQAAVAESRFRLLRQQVLQRQPQLGAGGFRLLTQPQADQIVFEMGPEQIFRR